MRVVDVTRVYPEPGATVWEADGLDVGTGETIRFGGDWRMMVPIAEAVDEGRETIAQVPEWAVIRVTPGGVS